MSRVFCHEFATYKVFFVALRCAFESLSREGKSPKRRMNSTLLRL